MRVRRLRVVVVLHATSVADARDAVVEPRVLAQRALDAIARRARGKRGGSGRERVGAVVGRAHRHIGEVREGLTAGVDERAVLDAEHARPRFQRERNALRRRGLGQARDHFVVPVEHEPVPVALVREHPRFSSHVLLERPVPVEVVRSDVEENSDSRPEGLGCARQLERRDLGHENSGVRVRGVQEREPDVAGSERGTARVVEHGCDQSRHRGLPVRPGHGDEDLAAGCGLLGGEIDFGPDRDTGLPRRHERRVAQRHPGTRHDDVGTAHELGEAGGRGVLDDVGAGGERGCDPIAVGVLARRAVLDHRDVVSGRGAMTHHGVARHAQPEHEDAAQSITPGMRMKSA